MDFAFTETQDDLRAAARRYLGDRYPLPRIAELCDTAGYDSGTWPELDRQGWLDPDLGMVELALLAEEGGRALLPVPWWATVGLALPVYQAAGVPLPGPATLADGGDTCRADRDGEQWRLHGEVPAVVDAAAATELVVAARAGGGVALFAVRADGPGVELAARSGLDPLRGCADLRLAGAPARLLVDAPAAGPVLAAARRRSAALLACEAVGVAERALELAVDYAKTRVQFDRPIGSYQAVAHQLAESYAELELARSLAYWAAGELADADAGSGPVAGSTTGAVTEALACAEHACAAAAVQVCEVAMQTCGGIGVTWEFALHWWYRRALWLRAYHAGRPDPLATIAGQLLGAGATSAGVVPR